MVGQGALRSILLRFLSFAPPLTLPAPLPLPPQPSSTSKTQPSPGSASSPAQAPSRPAATAAKGRPASARRSRPRAWRFLGGWRSWAGSGWLSGGGFRRRWRRTRTETGRWREARAGRHDGPWTCKRSGRARVLCDRERRALLGRALHRGRALESRAPRSGAGGGPQKELGRRPFRFLPPDCVPHRPPADRACCPPPPVHSPPVPSSAESLAPLPSPPLRVLAFAPPPSPPSPPSRPPQWTRPSPTSRARPP